MENLETQRLIIRELEIKDAMRLSEYRDKREVAFYQSWWRYPYQKALKRVEYCVKHPFDGSRGNYQLGVVLKENNILIGDYFLEVLESNSITIGYTFDSDYWQHGYAIESMRALLLELKNRYNFKIVFAHVYDDNIISIRLLKNLGFVQYETSKIMGDIGFKLRL